MLLPRLADPKPLVRNAGVDVFKCALAAAGPRAALAALAAPALAHQSFRVREEAVGLYVLVRNPDCCSMI